jgi:hypothetical protein
VSLFFCGVDVDILLRQNAFLDKLTPLGLNMFNMLVVDLMHKVELSVWKAVFIHLLRLLDCHDENLKHELDQRRALIEPLATWHWLSVRFREIPPFGTDGIRRITTNRSELKKMTAYDYEDTLQVGGVVDRSQLN